jgi:hypothetical protein
MPATTAARASSAECHRCCARTPGEPDRGPQLARTPFTCRATRVLLNPSAQRAPVRRHVVHQHHGVPIAHKTAIDTVAEPAKF